LNIQHESASSPKTALPTARTKVLASEHWVANE